mgnify:CR=1 FL=1
MIKEITTCSLDVVREAYKVYLYKQPLSKNTIITCVTDSFYIWRKQGSEIFWNIIFSNSFETDAKNTILQILRQQSNGNIESNINSYMAHLRRFRRFLQGESVLEIVETNSLKITSKNASTKAAMVPPTPSVEQVEHYLTAWDSLEDYHLQENALDKIFISLCPKNDNITDILLKISVLNDFYSTNIFKAFPVAKHILSLDIDKRLRCGDSTLVNDIREVSMGGKAWNFYSFATKYCSHHMPLYYPIYDSYVDEVLRYFRNVDGFASFRNKELKDYDRFKSILYEFKKFYSLDNYNLKELDKYLWQLGKNKYESTL